MNLENQFGLLSYSHGVEHVIFRRSVAAGDSMLDALAELGFEARRAQADRAQYDRIITERVDGKGYLVTRPGAFAPANRQAEVREPAAPHVAAAKVVHGKLLRRTGRLDAASGATAC